MWNKITASTPTELMYICTQNIGKILTQHSIVIIHMALPSLASYFQKYAREFKIYGILFILLHLIILIGLIVFDQVVMPSVVGLDEVIAVPSVAGMKQQEAVAALQTKGLEVKITGEQFNSNAPAGTVLSQLPYPASLVRYGRRVYLTISKGKQTIPMPRVIGLTLREARITLLKAGLQLNNVFYVRNDSVARDIVCAQYINSSRDVEYGQLIDLDVSLGAVDAEITVPDLTGKTPSEAEEILVGLGLRIGTTTFEPSGGTFLPNSIITQFPVSGTIVAAGSAINLIVGK